MKEEYKIQGIDCANCARKVEEKVSKEPYVKSIKIDIITDSLLIDSEEQNKVIELIKKIEPDAKISQQKNDVDDENPKSVIVQLLVGVVLIITAQLFSNNISFLIMIIAYLIIGYKVLLKSLRNILKGNIFDEFFLMSLATIAAILIGDIFEATMVMFLYMIGEYLQIRATNRSKRAIKEILEFQVKEVEQIKEGVSFLVTPEDLKEKDIIKIKVGEKVPVDTILLDEKCLVNTSVMTGESVPRVYYKGEEVLAGMIVENKTALLEVKRIYSDSAIAKMLKLIKDSSENKSKTEKFITKFAKIYTPIVVGLALSLIIILPLFQVPLEEAIYRAIILLVISCPCALVISVPLGYFMTITKNTKEGILVKGSNYVDALIKMEVLVVDKTGTLTKGNFEVDKIINYSDYKLEEILEIIAKGEKSSSHPVAKSIYNYYKKNYKKKITGEEIIEVKGMGIKYNYNNKDIIVGNKKLLEVNGINIQEEEMFGTIVYVGVGNNHCMTIVVKDKIKEDTIKGLELLKKDTIKDIIMLTGDNNEVAQEVAQEVGIKRFYSELLPEDKVRILKEIKEEYNCVGFVGDGINDAATITLADVGMAMGELGSDVAIESADVIINNDSLMSILKAREISKKGVSIIKMNIIMAIGIKILFITLSLFGMTNMIEAIFADVGVTILAILNSLRILK